MYHASQDLAKLDEMMICDDESWEVLNLVLMAILL